MSITQAVRDRLEMTNTEYEGVDIEDSFSETYWHVGEYTYELYENVDRGWERLTVESERDGARMSADDVFSVMGAMQ